MAPDSQKLQELRTKILESLVEMSDHLVGDDDIDFEALLVLGRATGKAAFLEKALDKAQELKNNSERADAILNVLEEVEIELSQQTESDKTEVNNSKSQTSTT